MSEQPFLQLIIRNTIPVSGHDWSLMF